MVRRSISCVLLACALAASSSEAASNKLTLAVPMSDGVKLTTDLFLPAGKGPFPVVLMRTPYPRDDRAALATAAGYAVVMQSMRGRYGSEGENIPFVGCGWAEHHDGVDTIAWLLKQSWCNGQIGTIGGSALGITQNLMAAASPPGLKCQFLRVAAVNMYSQAAYVGGALRKEQAENWTVQNKFDPKVREIWGGHTTFDDYWANFDASARFAMMNVPAVHVGGWFDTFSQGTIDSFVGRQTQGGPGSKGKQKLVMGPWTHGGFRRGEKQGELMFPRSQAPKQYDELRWMDYHLKGVANGVMDEPAVAYYVMGDTSDTKAPGNDWRFADAWPVPANDIPYYFQKTGQLAITKPATSDESLQYTFDPKDPCPTIGGKNLTISRGPMNQNRIEKRKDVLLFTTDALEKPVEVTGRVSANVFVSSSAVDTDLSVRLCDVYPDGRSYEMAEGILRLRHRDGLDKNIPLEPDKIYQVKVDCWSTSIIFNKGHRIRAIVTSSNYPRFDINGGMGKPWRDGMECVSQTNRIYCDGEHASCLVLPVVMGK